MGYINRNGQMCTMQMAGLMKRWSVLLDNNQIHDRLLKQGQQIS